MRPPGRKNQPFHRPRSVFLKESTTVQHDLVSHRNPASRPSRHWTNRKCNQGMAVCVTGKRVSAGAAAESGSAATTCSKKWRLDEDPSVDTGVDAHHNSQWMVRQLVVRFSVSRTSRTYIERCVRHAYPPVSGLDMLAELVHPATGGAPPTDAHVTVIVARALVSVEIIGLPLVQLAISEACAFAATLRWRLYGASAAVVLHFGLRDVEGGEPDPGPKCVRGKGYADIPPFLFDDRHDHGGGSTASGL